MFREMPVWAPENGRGIWLLLDSLALLPGVTATVIGRYSAKAFPRRWKTIAGWKQSELVAGGNRRAAKALPLDE